MPAKRGSVPHWQKATGQRRGQKNDAGPEPGLPWPILLFFRSFWMILRACCLWLVQAEWMPGSHAVRRDIDTSSRWHFQRPLIRVLFCGVYVHGNAVGVYQAEHVAGSRHERCLRIYRQHRGQLLAPTGCSRVCLCRPFFSHVHVRVCRFCLRSAWYCCCVVCDRLNEQDEGELLAFVGGMLGEGEDANQFVADLRQTRVAAAAKKSEIEASVVPAGAPAEADNIKQSGKKGGGGGRGSGYLTGSSADRRMNKGGAQNLRDLSSQKAREAEEAQARLERNLQMAGASKSNSKVDLSALAPEDGMTAYVKQDEMDEFGLAHLKKDSKKKKAAQKGANRGGIDDALDGVSGVSGDENAAPSSQDSFKPKVSRAERAKMLLHMQSNSVFLAPGRHLTTWVGNGDEYKLVGNCLDCGKIMSNQEVGVAQKPETSTPQHAQSSNPQILLEPRDPLDPKP